MPLITVPGVGDVGQSAAINYYLAAELNFMGKNHFEAATVLSIQEHVKEMNAAFRVIVPYGKAPAPEALDMWFEGGPVDRSPAPADSKHRSKRNLAWFAARIDACLSDSGYAVGTSTTLADLLIYNAFAEVLHDHEAAPSVAAYKKEPFTSKSRTDAVINECAPKVAAVCAAVANNPRIKAYLENRGVQRF